VSRFENYCEMAWRVLTLLDRENITMSQSDIARAFGINPGRIHYIFTGLQRQELITQRRSGKCMLSQLTEKGRAAAKLECSEFQKLYIPRVKRVSPMKGKKRIFMRPPSQLDDDYGAWPVCCMSDEKRHALYGGQRYEDFKGREVIGTYLPGRSPPALAGGGSSLDGSGASFLPVLPRRRSLT